MRKCKITGKVWDGHKKIELDGVCDFHQWGQGGELANGEGCFDPVAIVEAEDGQVYTVDVRQVRFLEGDGVTEAMAAAAITKAVACCLIPPLSSQVIDSRCYLNLFSRVIEAALNAREGTR